MVHPFYVIVAALGFFAVFGVVCMFVGRRFLDKEQPQN